MLVRLYCVSRNLTASLLYIHSGNRVDKAYQFIIYGVSR
jgi:hypothetical protein